MPVKLSVNLNAVAQLRNRRDLPWPSVTGMARVALDAGAHGLTVHPRPDQRHIRFTDVGELRELLANDYPGREFNVEGYPTEHFLTLAEGARPEQVTLVPDDPAQSTSDHGWDFAAHGETLAPIVTRLRRGGMRVSLFVDADPALIDGAAATGCDGVELYTGPLRRLSRRPGRRGRRDRAARGDGRRRPRPRAARQRRSRPDGREPARPRRPRAGSGRGVDRARDHGRRAAARHGRGGAPLPRRLRARGRSGLTPAA